MALFFASLFCTLLPSTVYFEEDFEAGMGRWTASTWKSPVEMGAFVRTAGEWQGGDGAMGIQTTEDLRYHAVSAKFDGGVATTVGKDLVVQFTVKHEKHEYNFCGGGYLKLFSARAHRKSFGGDTPYSVMFGPDICSYDTAKIHAILQHKGSNLEKVGPIKLDYNDKNKFTHLYTLQLKADGTYEVWFDEVSKASGVILEDWPFPAAQIDDPKDAKPSDWVEEQIMPDPADVKPEGWDDIPEQIPDPDAEKPEDWSDQDDGEWEPPMITNVAYKGEWKQKQIVNPDYVGEWSAAQIDNPLFDANVAQFTDIGAVGFELWTVSASRLPFVLHIHFVSCESFSSSSSIDALPGPPSFPYHHPSSFNSHTHGHTHTRSTMGRFSTTFSSRTNWSMPKLRAPRRGARSARGNATRRKHGSASVLRR